MGDLIQFPERRTVDEIAASSVASWSTSLAEAARVLTERDVRRFRDEIDSTSSPDPQWEEDACRHMGMTFPGDDDFPGIEPA